MFPKRLRKINRKIYSRIFRSNKKVRGFFGYFLIASFGQRSDSNLKFGIVIPKKFGKAVERNHLRRYYYSFFYDFYKSIVSRESNPQDIMKELSPVYIVYFPRVAVDGVNNLEANIELKKQLNEIFTNIYN